MQTKNLALHISQISWVGLKGLNIEMRSKLYTLLELSMLVLKQKVYYIFYRH